MTNFERHSTLFKTLTTGQLSSEIERRVLLIGRAKTGSKRRARMEHWVARAIAYRMDPK